MGLPHKKDNFFSRDYINSGSLLWREEDEEQLVGREVTERMREMQDNPQDYFNFGFNSADFGAYLSVLYTKRVQRQFVTVRTGEVAADFMRVQRLIATQPTRFIPGNFHNL